MMEQIYNDFVTKMLLKIQEGLMITQDYFTELFGRYVKYLLVMDSFGFILSLTITIIGIVALYKQYKWVMSDSFDEDSPRAILGWMLPGIFVVIGFIATIVLFSDLIKTIYIPEIRVYQELQPMIK